VLAHRQFYLYLSAYGECRDTEQREALRCVGMAYCCKRVLAHRQFYLYLSAYGECRDTERREALRCVGMANIGDFNFSCTIGLRRVFDTRFTHPSAFIISIFFSKNAHTIIKKKIVSPQIIVFLPKT